MDLEWNKFLEANLRRLLDSIGLHYQNHHQDRGILFAMDPYEANPQVRRAFGRRSSIWSSHEAAAHLIRQVCRARALSTVKLTRLDSEGTDQIDLEASSNKLWKNFLSELTPKRKALLDIYRAGAAFSVTRRLHGDEEEEAAWCEACNMEVRPSLRHLWAECQTFTPAREQIERCYSVPHTWWGRQPRVTSKSGWITMQAAPTADRRAVLQVATCRLGMVILSQTEPTTRAQPHHEL